jgi:hypothetical protein
MVRAGVVGGLLIASCLLLVHDVAAQDFRVTYSVDRSRPNRARVTGEVLNTGRADALDVYVTAEALDAAGKVIGRGIAFVSHSIAQGMSASFEAVIPVKTAAASFRVRVTNYRTGLGGPQAP